MHRELMEVTNRKFVFETPTFEAALRLPEKPFFGTTCSAATYDPKGVSVSPHRLSEKRAVFQC